MTSTVIMPTGKMVEVNQNFTPTKDTVIIEQCNFWYSGISFYVFSLPESFQPNDYTVAIWRIKLKH